MFRRYIERMVDDRVNMHLDGWFKEETYSNDIIRAMHKEYFKSHLDHAKEIERGLKAIENMFKSIDEKLDKK